MTKSSSNSNAQATPTPPSVPARTEVSPATARARRKRRWRLKIAAVLFAMLIACVICEVLLRVLIGAPLAQRRPVLHIQANPYRGWAMIPNTTHYAYHHPVHINNLGLRGDDIGDKQTNEIRILALGDSMVYGQGVAGDQTIPVSMQSMLNDSAKKGGTDTSTNTGANKSFTVVNGGLRSYSTNQELGLLQELGPTIKPDVVVVFWYWNDVKEHAIPEHNHRFSITGPIAFDTHTKLEGWELTKWHIVQFLRRSALLMWTHDSIQALRTEVITPEQSQDALARLDGYLAQFRKLAQAQRFKLYLAVIPDPNSLKRPHPSSDYTLLVQAMAQKHEIPSFDLFNDAAKAYDGGLRLPIVPYDGHYNGDANQRMARGIVRFLNKQLKGNWPRANWQ